LLTKPSVNNFQKPVRKFKQKKQLVIGESAPFLSREVTFVCFIGLCPIFKVVLLIRYVPSWSYKKTLSWSVVRRDNEARNFNSTFSSFLYFSL